MIEGVRNTAIETIGLIKEIKQLMSSIKIQIRDNYKFYSQDYSIICLNTPIQKLILLWMIYLFRGLPHPLI
jgi:hypothetical protein